MKNKLLVLLLISILLISGCGLTSFTTKEKEQKKISRDEAEFKAFKFLYEHTKNKEVYDQELKIENYVFDSWKEEDIWHVVIYVGHTFIEIWVYDDGSDQIKVLQKTDYWKNVPKEVKTAISEKTGKKLI